MCLGILIKPEWKKLSNKSIKLSGPWFSVLVCCRHKQSRLSLSVNYQNVGPLLLRQPRFTDLVRLASGLLSFSASRPCQWQTGTLMSKHCLLLPAYSRPQTACKQGTVTQPPPALPADLVLQGMPACGNICWKRKTIHAAYPKFARQSTAIFSLWWVVSAVSSL